MTPEQRSHRRVALALAALLFFGYFLTGSGTFYSRDSVASLGVTQQCLEGRGAAVESPYDATRGPDGKLYSHFPPGESLWLTPFYALGLAFRDQQMVPTASGVFPACSFFFASQSNCLSGAILHGYFFLIALDFCAPPIAVTATLASATLTLLCPYAKINSVDLVIAWSLVGALYHLRKRHAVAAGALLGLAFACRPNYLCAWLGALLWTKDGRQRAALGAGFAPWLALCLAYNAYRFGSCLDFGYRDDWSPNPFPALYNFGLSPYYAFWIYSPATLAALWGLRRAWRSPNGRALTALIGCLSLPPLLVHLTHAGFDGGLAWGPRYSVPLIALWNLGLVWVFQSGAFRRLPCIALLFASGALQLWAVLVPTSHYWVHPAVLGRVDGGLRASFDQIVLQGRPAPIDIWFLHLYPERLHGWLLPLGVAGWIAAAAALAAALREGGALPARRAPEE